MSLASATGPDSLPVKSTWFIVFALVGLVASSASAFVHYQLLNDPTYASFCDVNATFSCTEAYSSRYGSVAGVPVAVFGNSATNSIQRGYL